MTDPATSPAVPNAYRVSLAEARQEWSRADPASAAARGDALLVRLPNGGVAVELAFYGRLFRVHHSPAESPTHPQFLAQAQAQASVTEVATGRTASAATEILVLHYLLTADGALPSGEWVSFHELPYGRIYQSAFAGRSLAPLSEAFGNDREAFVRAAASLGGEPMRLGDAAFWFRAFPRLAVAAVLWLGEDELPGAVNILFDSAAGHYLPTEDLSAVGGMLSGRLLRARFQGVV